jgi:hypothetical protein
MIEATLSWLSWLGGGPSDAGSALRLMPQYARWSTQVNESVLGVAHLQSVTIDGQAMMNITNVRKSEVMPGEIRLYLLLELMGQVKRAIGDISHVRRHCIGKRCNNCFGPALSIEVRKLGIVAIDELD